MAYGLMKVLGLLWTEILLSTMYGKDKARNEENLIQINSEEHEWMPANTMTSASNAYGSRSEQWKYDPSKLRRICMKTISHGDLFPLEQF